MCPATWRNSILPAVLLMGLCLPERLQPSLAQQRPDVTPHLTILDFTLGRTTLTGIQSKLGAGKIVRCSREEEAAKEVCYFSANGRTKVIFQTGFSGGWTKIDGFKVVSIRIFEPCYRDCVRSLLPENSIRTNGGLKLGLTRKEVAGLLGRPSHATARRLTFEWSRRIPMSKEEAHAEGRTSEKQPYWDVLDTINVVFSGSVVAEFDVHHIVTS